MTEKATVDLTLVDDYGDTLNIDTGAYRGQPRVYVALYRGDPGNVEHGWDVALSADQARQIRDYLNKVLDAQHG